MATLKGEINPNYNIEFLLQETTAESFQALSTSVVPSSTGDYVASVVNGVYTINIGPYQFKNVHINSDGNLNDFLGDANGGYM